MSAMKRKQAKPAQKTFIQIARAAVRELRRRRNPMRPGPERRVLTIQIRAIRKQIRLERQAKAKKL